jgi:hypothetical protein
VEPSRESVVTGPIIAVDPLDTDLRDHTYDPPTHHEARGWRRAALPVGILGIAVGCLLAWREALGAGVFDDTFWHRAAGVWMLDHHQVLRHDVFSYTVAGRSWFTPEWGYDVLLAGSIRAIGPSAFWLLSAGLASVTVVVVALRTRFLGAGWTWTGLLCIETGAAITLFLDDRPQIVSYLFLALLLLLLTTARRRSVWLWPVPFLFVLWVNMHGSFLLGLAVVALETVVAFVPIHFGRVTVSDPLARKPALAVLVASGAATLVNPFGPGVYSSAFGVTFNSTVRQLIGEWQSPNFHDPAMLAVIVVPIAITVAYLAMAHGDVPFMDLALTAFLLVYTLDATRFLPYFAIAWCGLAARCTPLEEERIRPTLLVWPLLAVLGVTFLHGPWHRAGTPASSVPVSAERYLQHHPGRVLSTYLWNDYLVWKGVPVFIDGRTELYTGTPVFGQYLALDRLTSNPDPILRSHHVDFVLWPTQSPLSIYLAHDQHWRVVWRSDAAEIFQYVG